VAMLRYASSCVRCTGIAIPLTLASLVCTMPQATAAEPAPAPRPLMRLPARIETLNEPAAPQPAVASPATLPDLIPVAGTAPVAAPQTPKPTAPPAAPTGNPLTRWFSERMAALPKPKSLLPSTSTSPADAAPSPTSVPTPLGEQTPSEASAAAQPATKESIRESVKETAAKPTVTAPVAATPDEMPTLSIDPASFKGALPGKTSRADIDSGWGAGEPFTRDDGTTGVAWKIEPFERVEVMFEDDVVSSIRIKLVEPVAVPDLAKQLEISDLRTVSILDEQGVSIGEVYPERGVILSVKPGTPTATAILIEPLDPESFVLRAEGELEACSANAVADLLYAIQLDPRHVRAHRLLLAMTSEQGKWTQALQLAETAGRLDPADVWTQLKHAGVLLALDRPAEAKAVLEAVKNKDTGSPLVAAQVQRLLGRTALAGDKPDHQAATEHFAETIRKASPLLAKRSPTMQAAAREVLLDAHLGTALAIAKGNWQQKSRVIPKWISRSETLVEEFKGGDREKMILELQLCRGALAVSAGSTEAVEPLPWVKRLLEIRETMGDDISDPWRRRQVDWETGQGLGDALLAAQKRGDATDMLDNATLTAAYLERGAEQRELTAAERRSFGELLFRIGIMHSLQRGDHATAVTWFDRVIPLWEEGDAVATDPDPGKVGESYVSMAISYWQVERREDALALSQRGVELMVAAVDRDELDERALAVAYGNLSTMYAEAGDEPQARTYAEMASRAEATGTVVK
jgi:tetratricopeptide (TPR) repeat protein